MKNRVCGLSVTIIAALSICIITQIRKVSCQLSFITDSCSLQHATAMIIGYQICKNVFLQIFSKKFTSIAWQFVWQIIYRHQIYHIFSWLIRRYFLQCFFVITIYRVCNSSSLYSARYAAIYISTYICYYTNIKIAFLQIF